MPRQIIIRLPDGGMDKALVKGLNKRLSFVEDSIKSKKKKKRDDELISLRKEVKVIKGMSGALASREKREMKQSLSAISSALGSLGKIRIPSPS